MKVRDMNSMCQMNYKSEPKILSLCDNLLHYNWKGAFDILKNIFETY